jgi:hypothetical protein
MAKVSKSKASAAELLEALDELQSEKGITKEYMVESLKLALEAAYRKNYETEENVSRMLVSDGYGIVWREQSNL